MAGVAAGFGAWLQSTLGSFGVPGQLAILFIVFFIDAVLFPMLPEAFVVLFYQTLPTFDTGISRRADLVITAATLLVVVLAAEVLANLFLYSLVKWKKERVPAKLTKAMNKWREFLVVSDERVVLLNRIVPIMPFTGAFIAVSPWDPKRAFSYLAIGGAVKYGAVIGVVALAGLVFDPRQTWWVSVGLIVVILGISIVSHTWMHRRWGAPEAPVANVVKVVRPDLHLHLPHRPPPEEPPAGKP
jgi:hypothetical protein